VDRRALLGARVGQQDQVDGAELGQPVAGTEGGELSGHQAGRHRGDADAGRDGADQAVDAAAEAGAAVRHADAVERAAHLGPGDARRRVDHERHRPGQVQPGGRRPHPHHAVPLDELAALLSARALADEHVEPVALKPLVQQAALVHREVEVD
jgi:hypothetical protein